MRRLEENENALSVLNLPPQFAEGLQVELTSRSEVELLGLLHGFNCTRNRNPNGAQPPRGVSVKLSTHPSKIGTSRSDRSSNLLGLSGLRSWGSDIQGNPQRLPRVHQMAERLYLRG